LVIFSVETAFYEIIEGKIEEGGGRSDRKTRKKT